MSLFEMGWDIVLIFGGLVAADYILIRRSARRTFKEIRKEVAKMPTIVQLLKLSKDPNFEAFVLRSIDTMERMNKMVERIEKEGIMWMLK